MVLVLVLDFDLVLWLICEFDVLNKTEPSLSIYS